MVRHGLAGTLSILKESVRRWKAEVQKAKRLISEYENRVKR
jgi:Cys-tRNA synthase (O-phospho-L-seryl-tRNA:Cys-tRNA synthase)